MARKARPGAAQRTRSGLRLIQAGWSRKRFRVAPGLILDVGSGAFPNPAADVLVDSELEDNRHRHGLPVRVDRPFVVARVEALPFADKSFAFVIASHIAEHVDDPQGLCRELDRVGRRGYVETPSPLCDILLHEDYHIWRVRSRRNRLIFTQKAGRHPFTALFADAFYRVFYAGRSDCSRRTLRLPNGALGSGLGWLLKASGAGLARLGVLHTRFEYGPNRPLMCETRERLSPDVAVIERGPSSGFVRTDQLLLTSQFPVRIIRYPGWPAPRYLFSVLRAALRCDALYSFFASEHTLIAASVFRLFRRGVVVAVGGYDVANLPVRKYGLPATGRAWVPKTCIRLASSLVAHSAAASQEVTDLVPHAGARLTTCHLAVDPDLWGPPVEMSTRLPCAVTMGYFDRESFSRKGLDRFIEAARSDPGTEYVIAGRIDQSALRLLPTPLPSNLRLTGYLSQAELRQLLWTAAVYVQLSWHESFGMAVAEAMACGCTPVISTDPALLEVCGSWAVVSPAPPDDVASIAAALRRKTDRLRMSEDTIARFSISRRAAVLRELVLQSSHRKTS